MREGAGLPLYTLHDFDISGFSIKQTLVTSDIGMVRRVNDERGGQGVASQAGDEGLRLPMSERGFGKEPWPFGRTAAQARHLGGRSGLVQEDEPVGLKPHDRLARRDPFLARLLDVGPIVLAGPQSFF